MDNLIALCARHHRMHHHGGLGIEGTDADDPNGIAFRQPGGRVIPGVAPPAPPDPTAADDPAVEPYVHPEHGRIDLRWLHLQDPPAV